MILKQLLKWPRIKHQLLLNPNIIISSPNVTSFLCYYYNESHFAYSFPQMQEAYGVHTDFHRCNSICGIAFPQMHVFCTGPNATCHFILNMNKVHMEGLHSAENLFSVYTSMVQILLTSLCC